MFKKLLLTLLAMPLLALAEKPVETNYVWVPFVGGTAEDTCRIIWREYDRIYHTESIILTRPGANTLIAVNDMLDSKHHNRIICSTSSMSIYNELAYPNTDFKTKQVKLLMKTHDQSTTWFVPNKNTSTNFSELIANFRQLNRPINVGIANAATETVAKFLNKKYKLPINIIPFKTVQQMYPALTDGSLDLALTPVSGIDLAEQGKFRMVGYHADYTWPKESIQYRNFALDDLELAQITPWLSISVPANSSPEFNQQIIRRVKFILGLPEFRSKYAFRGFQVRDTSGKELEAEVEKQYKTIAPLWK